VFRFAEVSKIHCGKIAGRRKDMRRKICAALSAFVLLLAAVSCDSRPTLRIYCWTYYLPDEVIRAFEQEFDVRVVYDQYASNEEMLARIQAGGVNFDLVFPSGDFVYILMQDKRLEPIDHSLLQNMGNIDPVILEKTVYDPGMEFSVPYFYGAAGITVNTAVVGEDFDRSWSIFSREDLKDRMTMLDDMREVMGGALTFLGYSVNSQNPDEINQAVNLIKDSWRPNLVKFDSEAFAKGFANGNFAVSHGYPEAIFEEIAGNTALTENTVFFIPKEGGPAYIDSMVIPKGAKNIPLAHEFIDFIHRPEIYAKFADAFRFPASVNVPARQLTTSTPMYTLEELANTELRLDVGDAFSLFDNAWNSIRIE
jgi:spermidine/putrescine transport system substrate-binding protein